MQAGFLLHKNYKNFVYYGLKKSYELKNLKILSTYRATTYRLYIFEYYHMFDIDSYRYILFFFIVVVN